MYGRLFGMPGTMNLQNFPKWFDKEDEEYDLLFYALC